MRYWSLSVVCAGMIAGLTGCGWQGMPWSTSSTSAAKTQATGGLAVVDLDRIATASGIRTRLDEMIKFRQVTLDNEFGKFSKDQNDKLKTLIDEVKEKFGDEVPAEEAKKLRSEAIAANNSVQQFRSSAQLNLNKYTEDLKTQFREVVRPIAHEVASKKGFSVVIPKNESLLLSVEPGSDITDDVILALQQNGKKTPDLTPPSEEEAKSEKQDKKKTAEKKTATREQTQATETK